MSGDAGSVGSGHLPDLKDLDGCLTCDECNGRVVRDDTPRWRPADGDGDDDGDDDGRVGDVGDLTCIDDKGVAVGVGVGVGAVADENNADQHGVDNVENVDDVDDVEDDEQDTVG